MRKFLEKEKDNGLKKENRLDFSKFDNKDRKLIEKRINYEYKTDEKIKKLNHPKSQNKINRYNKPLLKTSKTSIEQSRTSRNILKKILNKESKLSHKIR